MSETPSLFSLQGKKKDSHVDFLRSHIQSKRYCTDRYDIHKRTHKGSQGMNNFRFSVEIEKDEESYTAFCPELQ